MDFFVAREPQTLMRKREVVLLGAEGGNAKRWRGPVLKSCRVPVAA